MTETDMLARSYKTSYRLSAAQLPPETAHREAWQAFYRMARISRWETSRVVANLPYELRTLLWYGLTHAERIDWLAIRANLSTAFPASPASVFRNTHGN